MSDDEAGGIGWARYRPAAQDDSFIWPPGLGDGDDDAWADRLWEEMRTRQRARRAAEAAELGFADAAAARAAAEVERRRRAAAAAEASARILGEERRKEADWREAMLRQVAEAAMPTRRADYESAWAALDARLRAPQGPPVAFADVPWPVRALAALGRGGAAAKAGPAGVEAAAREASAASELRDLVLHGVSGPAEVKKRIRAELLRWHPDKLLSRLQPRLAPSERETVLAGTRAVAQLLTALMSAPGG